MGSGALFQEMAERKKSKFGIGNLKPFNLEKLVFIFCYLKYLRFCMLRALCI